MRKLIFYSFFFLFGCMEKSNSKIKNNSLINALWEDISYTADEYSVKQPSSLRDYLGAYALSCDSFTYAQDSAYIIVEDRLLYRLKKNKYESVLSYEVIEPKSKERLDEIVFRLKNLLCTPRPEDRIDNLYIIDSKFLVFLHIDNADKQEFEKTLLLKKSSVFKIQVRNTEKIRYY